MKYIITNLQGKILQWGNDSTIKELPKGAKLLTDEEWKNRHNNPKFTTDKKNRLKRQLIISRKSYLNQTDWYLLREIDQPNSYPQEIKIKRTQARQEINQIELANSLSALSKFNTFF